MKKAIKVSYIREYTVASRSPADVETLTHATK